MPNSEIYTAELEGFKRKYNMPQDYDLKELAVSQQKFQYLNNIITGSDVATTPAAQFKAWAVKTMNTYLEANTTLNANGKYMSAYPKSFLDDFEKLADAKYRSELNDDEEPLRNKFGGAKKKDIVDALANSIKNMNKTLPALWKDKLKKGTMKPMDLQAITMNVIDIVRDPKADKTGIQDKIISVVAAHEAMKQLRESRNGIIGWFWKRFNQHRDSIEEASLNIFEAQVNELRSLNYDVDKIAADLTGKTIFGLEAEGTAKAEATKPDAALTANEEKKVGNGDINKEPIRGIDLENPGKNAVNSKADEKKINDAPQKSSLSIPDLAENLSATNKSSRIEDIKHDVPNLTNTK